MRAQLALAGPRSFEMAQDGYYTVNLDTLLCDCYTCHYHGVLTAHEVCKHARLAQLVKLSSASEEEDARIREQAFLMLRHLVHTREQRKGTGQRCRQLLAASTEDELLSALDRFPSVPPVGTCTGLDDLSTEPAVLQVASEPVFECTFQDGTGELGICFLAARDGLNLAVASYVPLSSGAPGPAPFTGERIRPGDVLQSVNGDFEFEANMMDDNSYQLEPVEGPMLLLFSRPPATTLCEGPSSSDGSSCGGRPQARQPKFARSHGPPKRRGNKPERSRAEAQRARPVSPTGPTVAVQAAALKAQLLHPDALQQLSSAEVTCSGLGYVP